MQATCTFTEGDQRKFAAASGDFNPMHMDPIAARRTQAGAPVVHGMHTLLYLLDYLSAGTLNAPIARMKVRFAKLLYVGETVEARVTGSDDTSLKAEVLVDGSLALTLKITFGRHRLIPLPDWHEDAPFVDPAEPCPLSIEEMAHRSGKLRLPDPNVLAEMFPHAANFLGARRVAALARTSYLVGMVLPGLHSMYTGLNAEVCEDDPSTEHAFFNVGSTDPRVRLVNLCFHGGGLSAQLETFVRMPPVRQASLQCVTQFVEPNEFAGTTALIVGGSRGLGELAAKIIVAGGGKVIVTYSRGKADAENLALELDAGGGECAVIPYDVLTDPGPQLGALQEHLSQLYYFATPPIATVRSKTFSDKAYERFCAFYVTGFERLLRTILAQANSGLGVFYPSSVAVSQPPAGMVEYAKAKTDGERLCAELAAQTPALKIVTARLPRMLTDLTATIHPVKTADPLPILLPLIRECMNVSRRH